MGWSGVTELSPERRRGGGEALGPTPPSLPSRCQPGLGASNLHLPIKRLPLGPRLKGRLRGQAKHRMLGPWGDTPLGTCGGGPCQAESPPTWAEAGPPQGHLCLLRAGRVTLEGDRLPTSQFHPGLESHQKTKCRNEINP